MLIKIIVNINVITYVCFLKWQHPGKPPEMQKINGRNKMALEELTKGKQDKEVGTMSAARVGLCADVTIKENNTIYIIKGQKSNPALCTRRYPGRVAEVFYKSGAGSERFPFHKTFQNYEKI